MGTKGETDVASKEPRLYNLDEDIGERTDVAEKNPKVVARLLALANRMDAEIGGTKPSARRPAGEVAEAKPLYPMSDAEQGKKDK